MIARNIRNNFLLVFCIPEQLSVPDKVVGMPVMLRVRHEGSTSMEKCSCFKIFAGLSIEFMESVGLIEQLYSKAVHMVSCFFHNDNFRPDEEHCSSEDYEDIRTVSSYASFLCCREEFLRAGSIPKQ